MRRKENHARNYLACGSLFSSLWLGIVPNFNSLPALTVNPASVLAQLNPNPGIFNESPFNRRGQHTHPSPAESPPPNEPLQAPDATLNPVNGRISIRFVNETGAVINYQVIGQTELLPLAGRSEITLQNLSLPTSFTFRRQDKGFLQVALQPDNPASGTITLSVRETTDFSADRTSLYIDQTGAAFLN